MKKQTISLLVIAALGAMCMAPDCEGQEGKDREQVEGQQTVYAVNQPIPTFKWSQDRDNLIQIYKMKNEARVTYAVARAFGTGEILWHCPSIGMPIPADTQLTNPLQRVYNHGAVIEQAEPNGTFTSKNTDGTYVLCVLPDGTITPQYTELKIEVFSRPVKVETVVVRDDQNKVIRQYDKVVWAEGKPSMSIKKKGK
jgi:hypothetical protein